MVPLTIQSMDMHKYTACVDVYTGSKSYILLFPTISLAQLGIHPYKMEIDYYTHNYETCHTAGTEIRSNITKKLYSNYVSTACITPFHKYKQT